MKNQRPCNIGHRLNGVFGDPVLVTSVGTTEAKTLRVLPNVTHRLFGLEGAAISEVGFDNDTMMMSHLFIGLLGTNRLDSRKTKLMFDMKKTRSMVNEETTPFVSIRGSFAVGVKCESQKT